MADIACDCKGPCDHDPIPTVSKGVARKRLTDKAHQGETTVLEPDAPPDAHLALLREKGYEGADEALDMIRETSQSAQRLQAQVEDVQGHWAESDRWLGRLLEAAEELRRFEDTFQAVLSWAAARRPLPLERDLHDRMQHAVAKLRNVSVAAEVAWEQMRGESCTCNLPVCPHHGRRAWIWGWSTSNGIDEVLGAGRSLASAKGSVERRVGGGGRWRKETGHGELHHYDEPEEPRARITEHYWVHPVEVK